MPTSWTIIAMAGKIERNPKNATPAQRSEVSLSDIDRIVRQRMAFQPCQPMSRGLRAVSPCADTLSGRAQDAFDLVDRVISQGFWYLANNPVAHDWMEFLAQLAQYPRSGAEHDLLEPVVGGVAVEQVGSILGKALFGQPVPVGLLYGALLALPG